MRIVLAGAGIGGLTTALALANSAGATVVEQATALQEAGAGVQLSPNATRVLAGLGLLPAIEAAAFEPQGIEVRDAASGRLLLAQTLGETARRRWGAPYLHVHRADLQGVLLDAVGKLGIPLRLGARVDGLDGTACVLAGGERLEADGVVGCDGLRSRVRAALWGEGAPRFTGQIAWRGVVDADRLPRGLIAPVAAVWNGPGRHFVHYFVRGGRQVNFVGVVEGAEPPSESWLEPGAPADLARAFSGWPAPVQALIAAVDQTWRWPLYDRAPLPRWSKGAFTLLGDAAHPMLPFLAQGAAMAIEDAAALARHIGAGPDLTDAFAAYEAERRPRTARVQAASRRNARLFHLPAPLGRAAFGAAKIADRVAPSAAAARFDWLYGET